MRIIVWSKRNLKELLRDPLTLAFTIGMPLVLLIIFYAIGLGDITDQYKMANFAPGIAVFSLSFVMLFTAILISTDRSTSFLTRLYSSKMRPLEFILGYALSMVPIIIVQSVLFYVIAGFMDNSLFSINMIWGILIQIPISLLYISIGILFGSLFTDKQVGGVTSVIVSGSSILNGMWFPAEFLTNDSAFGIITNILPFRAGVTLARAFLSGDFSNAMDNILLPFGIIMAYTLVICSLAVFAFRRKMIADTK